MAAQVRDRDIVIRAVAQGRDVEQTQLSAICSTDLTLVSPDDPLERAVARQRRMRTPRYAPGGGRAPFTGCSEVQALSACRAVELIERRRHNLADPFASELQRAADLFQRAFVPPV